MEITHVAILGNSIAGNGSSGRFSTWLETELRNRQITSQVFMAEWPETLDQFSDVWILGGDGTINYFINQYPDCSIPIALFKTGTGNDFAWKLYGNKSNKEQLDHILQASPKWIDAGKFNDRLYLNCIGIGFDGEIVQSMKTIRFLGGHLGYLLAVIIKIFRFKEYTYTIATANESWQDKFLVVMVVNSSRAGGGFLIAPEASITDGLLNMVLCKKMPILKRLRYLPIMKKGKHTHLPFVLMRELKAVTILPSKTVAVQIDGELHYADRINIAVLKEKFLFRY